MKKWALAEFRKQVGQEKRVSAVRGTFFLWSWIIAVYPWLRRKYGIYRKCLNCRRCPGCCRLLVKPEE